MSLSTNQENNISLKYVIAIDVGTSRTKIGLINQDGKVVSYSTGRYDTHRLPNGGVEQDPLEWWHVVSSGVKKVVEEFGINSENVVAIGVTSQWAVTVAVDELGEPLMNAISWMDTRGIRYNAQVVKGFPSLQGYGLRKLLKWVKIVGATPQLGGSDNTAHILYIKNELPEIYQKTFKFLEPMDFINMRLTGKAHATQNTNVATLLIDNRPNGTKDYNPWALMETGIDRQKLPDLLPVEGIVGTLQETIAREWGLSPNTIVITSACDNSVATIGSGAIADFEAVAVLGTSGMLVFHVPYKKTDLIKFMTTFPSALNNRYLLWADTGNTCNVIDSFINNLVYSQDAFSTLNVPDDVYTRLNQAVTQVDAGSDGVLFLPWFSGGALVPSNDPFLRGGFINLTNSTTRNHLARAVLEGIAFNWRWLKDSAEAFTKINSPTGVYLVAVQSPKSGLRSWPML